ncbi:MAG: calcium-binding protein, partial [Nitrospiraceae bacterium]
VEAVGEGTDTVQIATSAADDGRTYRIEDLNSANVEIVGLTGNGQYVTLMGNAEANTLKANSLYDTTLLGGSGDDTLFGGNGSDRLDGGTGADTLYGGLCLAHNMCWTPRPPCRRLAAWSRLAGARSRRRS